MTYHNAEMTTIKMPT